MERLLSFLTFSILALATLLFLSMTPAAMADSDHCGLSQVTVVKKGKSLVGTNKSERFALEKGALSLDAGGGNDLICIEGDIDGDVLAGPGNDAITVIKAKVKIDAGPGGDSLTSFAGKVKADLGPGNDSATTQHGEDSIRGKDGVDVFESIVAEGRSELIGGAEDDRFLIGPNALANGGPGNDRVLIHEPSASQFVLGMVLPSFYGGPGDDRVSAPGQEITLGLRLFGGPGNDALYGNAGNDIIYGGPGTDKLAGMHGDDLVLGELDPDYIDAGAGNDTCDNDPADEQVNDCENTR